MRVGFGEQVFTVLDESEAFGYPRRRHPVEDRGCFVGEPGHIEAPDELRELLAFVTIDVGEHCGVVDDDGAVPGSFSDHCGEVVEQVTLMDGNRAAAGGFDSSVQAVHSAGLPRPDQALQPQDVFVVGWVERVEVDPAPPDHLGGVVGQWSRAPQRAMKCWSGVVGAGDADTVVVIGVSVRQEGEASRGPNFDERKRLREEAERGKERGAPCRLVGLGPPVHHDGAEAILLLEDQLPKITDTRHGFE
ncbi:MAG: hypothetical protein M0004_16490 [Actinomycetota bacterium]|nr:hypothetical protein [Actinomycetota bacterium]